MPLKRRQPRTSGLSRDHAVEGGVINRLTVGKRPRAVCGLSISLLPTLFQGKGRDDELPRLERDDRRAEVRLFARVVDER